MLCEDFDVGYVLVFEDRYSLVKKFNSHLVYL